MTWRQCETCWILFLTLSHVSMQIKGFSNCSMSMSHIFLQFHPSNFPTFSNFSLKPRGAATESLTSTFPPIFTGWVRALAPSPSLSVGLSCSQVFCLLEAIERLGNSYKRNNMTLGLWLFVLLMQCFLPHIQEALSGSTGCCWIPEKTSLHVSVWVSVFPGPKYSPILPVAAALICWGASRPLPLTGSSFIVLFF